MKYALLINFAVLFGFGLFWLATGAFAAGMVCILGGVALIMVILR